MTGEGDDQDRLPIVNRCSPAPVGIIDGDNVGFDEAVAALRDLVGHVGGAIPGRDSAIILYKRIYVVPCDQL